MLTLLDRAIGHKPRRKTPTPRDSASNFINTGRFGESHRAVADELLLEPSVDGVWMWEGPRVANGRENSKVRLRRMTGALQSGSLRVFPVKLENMREGRAYMGISECDCAHPQEGSWFWGVLRPRFRPKKILLLSVQREFRGAQRVAPLCGAEHSLVRYA